MTYATDMGKILIRKRSKILIFLGFKPWKILRVVSWYSMFEFNNYEVVDSAWTVEEAVELSEYYEKLLA